MIIKQLLKNPFVSITLVALLVQFAMLLLFYNLPDPLGLSLTELFEGKIFWQVLMAVGTILFVSAIFAFLKAPRALALFFGFYFVLATADYEVFRFSHQRLSFSFLRTYFHFSNITDATTIGTLGGDLKGTILYISLALACVVASIVFCVVYTMRKRAARGVLTGHYLSPEKPARKVPVVFISVGAAFLLLPLIFFACGVRGDLYLPITHTHINLRMTLGKYTLTAPVLHIAVQETFEFFYDNEKITDEIRKDMESFLPEKMVANRLNVKDYPVYRAAPNHEYRAKQPYNIVFIMGESFKGRIFNRMLEGDTTLAPNLWNLATGKMFTNGGGGLWFKNGYSGGYPTVRGTMATYLGFPSHPNRDLPSFYSSNHFTGIPEYLKNYHKFYITVSNPIFDHTLPFVERFYGNNWSFPQNVTDGTIIDSVGIDMVISHLPKLPTDSSWFIAFNTITSHIPFFEYPDDFAPKPDDAMARYYNAIRYTDQQLGRFFEKLSSRPDFERTVIVVLGDHDTPVDSIDYAVPQPLGVSVSRIFMGIFSPDSNLFNGLTVREDVASQLDMGPTVMDLAQVREPNHFWGYDLLTEERPAEQPSLFFSQNAYFLGFSDHVLTGGLDNEEVYSDIDGSFKEVKDSVSLTWKKRAISTSKVLRSLLRNDNMEPR